MLGLTDVMTLLCNVLSCDAVKIRLFNAFVVESHKSLCHLMTGLLHANPLQSSCRHHRLLPIIVRSLELDTSFTLFHESL